MKIKIKVQTQTKKEGVEELAANEFKVRVNVPPIEGRANERVVEILAEHFEIAKSRVSIVHGHKSKNKLVEISD